MKYLLFFSILLILNISCSSSPSKTNSKKEYSGVGHASLSSEIIKKYSPRSVDPETLRKVEASMDIRTPSLGVISPDGSKLFVNWNVTGVNQIWRLDGPMKFPVQMTGGNERAYVQDITPDGKFIVISRDRNGEENPGVYLQSVRGGALIKVYRKTGVRAFFQFISHDGKYLYFRNNENDRANYDFYRYEISTKETELVLKVKGSWVMVDHLKNGKILLVFLKGNTAREYYQFNKGKLEPLFGQGEDEQYSAAYLNNKGELIVKTNKFGEYQRLYKWRKGIFTPITADRKFDISGFSIDPSRKRILYEINKKGYFHLKAISAKTLKRIYFPEWKPNEAEHTYSGFTSSTGRYTTLGVSMYRSPRKSFVYDWERRQLTKWTLPSQPEISTKSFTRAKLKSYTARDGVKIPMFVRKPSQCFHQNCPVIVNFHGGPESQRHPGFSPRTELYLQKGFIFVEPNVRGSRGYGKSWLHSDNGAKRLDVLTDIEDCAIFIKKNWKVDGVSPKVGVMGGSYGGYSALVAMTIYAGTYDAGVANVGMSNLVSFLNNTSSYRRYSRVTEYGDPVKDREALMKLSPINYIDKIKDPLLLIHGVNDPRVPAGESVQIQSLLEKKNIDSTLLLFPDEGHGVRKRKNRAIATTYTIDFFVKHLLKGSE
ncbi:MAG: prolyl oligopeptidase family serine peptidase [Bacteriovoracaceae bacterium]|nr:prolyl oligopeptidase family serine peptidase [Bacteriovoracaceae bacterium]